MLNSINRYIVKQPSKGYGWVVVNKQQGAVIRRFEKLIDALNFAAAVN
jgi:hypothetical protein